MGDFGWVWRGLYFMDVLFCVILTRFVYWRIFLVVFIIFFMVTIFGALVAKCEQVSHLCQGALWFGFGV